MQICDSAAIKSLAPHITLEVFEQENERGLTPLEVCISEGDVSCGKELLTRLNEIKNQSVMDEADELVGSIDRILGKADKLHQKTILHFAAERTPTLVNDILLLSSEPDDLLAKKDVRGLLPLHYDATLHSCYRPLYTKRFGNPTGQNATQAELDAVHGDVAVHKAIADGNKDVLQALFLQDDLNVYKCLDTSEGKKSILEVAAESGRGDLVRFILTEHRKLLQKAQDKCVELESALASYGGIQEVEQCNQEVATLQNQKCQAYALRDSICDISCKHANQTLLSVLSQSKAEDWHSSVIENADLTQGEPLVAELLQGGMNPLIKALQSGNNPVAQKIIKEATACVNHDVEAHLVGKKDVSTLLECGFGLRNLYDSPYTSKEDVEVVPKEFVSVMRGADVLQKEMTQLRKQVTSQFGNKGSLLPYAHAISSDSKDAEGFKDKLSGIKDGDKTLLSLRSLDGHNLGTFVAAFGGIEHWQMYEKKYQKLQTSDKDKASAAGNASAQIGSPLQVALLAKHFAQSKYAKKRREMLFNYLVQEYPGDLLVQNKDGENLLHTIVRCGDMEVLELMLTHVAHTNVDLSRALNQKSNSGRTPLELAVQMDNQIMLRAIVEGTLARYGMGGVRDLLLKSRVLHTAVMADNSVIMNFIASIQKMLNISLAPNQEIHLEKQRDSRARDPFMLAVEKGSIESVKVLLEAGFGMQVENIKKAVIQLPGEFSENKISQLCKLLSLNEREETDLLEKREEVLLKMRASSLADIKTRNVALDEVRTDEVLRLVREEASLFRKPHFHVSTDYLSDFQRERDKSAACLEENLRSGKESAVLASFTLHPGIIDSPECRSGVISALLECKNLELLRLAIQSSNKFMRNANGDSLLQEIIKKTSGETLKVLVGECINIGYNLADVSREGKTAFDLIGAKDPDLAGDLQKLFAAHKKRVDELMNSLNEVLDLANAGAKSNAVSKLLKTMSFQSEGYDFPVLAHLFAQISSESMNGEQSFITKRLQMLGHVLGKINYFGERDPITGDNITHMLFRTLRNEPFILPDFQDVLASIIKNPHFSPELVLEKNYEGVSALDILSQTKGCENSLSTINRAFPSFAGKVSFSRMLMLSVLGKDVTATRNFLEAHQGSLLKLNVEDEDGISIVECAALNGDVRMLELLLEYGAEINAVDRHGCNVLDKMLERSLETGADISPMVMSFLIKRGIDLECVSGGLTTLERLVKLESRKDSQYNRRKELLAQPKFSQSDYVEFRALTGSRLNVNYCDLLYEAEKERKKLNEKLTRDIASSLYSSNRASSFVSGARSTLGQLFQLDESKSNSALIGGVLHVKIATNAAVELDTLFDSAKPHCVRRSILSFSGGKDLVEVERRRGGLTNYTCKKGCIVITLEVKIAGKYKSIDVSLQEDGSVLFDKKDPRERATLESLLRKNKIDFTESKVYIDGLTLESALKNPTRRKVESRCLEEAARALREAGALGGENVLDPSSGQVTTGLQHPAPRRSDSV